MQVLNRCCGAGRKKAGQPPPREDKPKQTTTPSEVPVGDLASLERDGHKVPEVGETNQAPSGSPNIKGSHPTKTLWQQAFQVLDFDTRERLQNKMGFNENSGNADENIAAIKNAVKKKEKDVQDGKLSVTVGREKIVLRDYTQNIVRGLTAAGNIAVPFLPPQAALPWAALKSIMGIAVAESEQLEDLFKVTDKVVRIVNRGVTYEYIYLNKNADTTKAINRNTLEKDLVRIYQDALSLLAKTHEMLTAGTWSRVKSTIGKPGFIPVRLGEIDDQEREISMDVDVLEKERSKNADDESSRMLEVLDGSMAKVDKGVERILENVGENERWAILNFISPVSFGDHHLDVKNKRTPGTGKWVLRHENFVSWEQSGSGIFWLQGTAGTGKTYLTSKVVDHILESLINESKDEGFAYFYCDRDEAKRHEEKHILQSIVRQLSTTSNNLESTQTKLHELYKQSKEEGRSELDARTCQEQIQTSLDVYPTTTIVIDALDEIVDDQSRSDLVSKLKRFVDQSENYVRVFVSSRPDAVTQHWLEALPDISIDPNDNKGDVKVYLEEEISKIVEKPGHQKLGDMKDKVIEKLLERCQGMFQWAALQIGQLGECKVESSINNRLEHLPQGLEQAYKEIWDEIQQKDGEEKLYIERAILWVMAAWTPFTSEQLLAAVRVNTNGESAVRPKELGEDELQDLCKNLLTIDTRQKVWRFSHLSVREYLEERMGWTSHVAQLHAAAACLTFFLKPDPQVISRREQMAESARQSHLSAMRKDIRAAEKSETSAEMVELMEKRYFTAEKMPPPGLLDPEEFLNGNGDEVFDVRHPFHIYARHHVFKHIRVAQRDQDKYSLLARLVQVFLESPSKSSEEYRRWYKQLSENFMSIHRDHFSAAGFDDFGCDLNGLSHSNQSILSPLEPGDFWQFRSQLEPPDVAAFAMCQFDLTAILEDWWSPESLDWNGTNGVYRTPLEIAAMSGAMGACINLVSKANADVNLDDPVHRAANKGHAEIVRYMLEVGKAKVDRKRPGDSVIAALQEPGVNLAIIKLLRAHGAALFPEGSDPFMYAARFGKEDIIEYLLKELDTSSLPVPGSGHSALGWASFFGYTKIADLLLEAGADPNWSVRTFGMGETPLTLALFAESDLGRPSCAESLRRHGAVDDPTAQAEGFENIRSKLTWNNMPRDQMIRMWAGTEAYNVPKTVRDGHVPHSRPVSPAS